MPAACSRERWRCRDDATFRRPAGRDDRPGDRGVPVARAGDRAGLRPRGGRPGPGGPAAGAAGGGPGRGRGLRGPGGGGRRRRGRPGRRGTGRGRRPHRLRPGRGAGQQRLGAGPDAHAVPARHRPGRPAPGPGRQPAGTVPAHPDPARADAGRGTGERDQRLQRRRGGRLPGVGRLRGLQGRPRPDDPDLGQRAGGQRGPGQRRRPRRHGHGHAPGRPARRRPGLPGPPRGPHRGVRAAGRRRGRGRERPAAGGGHLRPGTGLGLPVRSAVRFRLPPELEATAPPEARGLRRDHVRLLVVDRADGSATHHRFHELPRLLEPGDLLVVNDSRTLPASLLGHTAAGVPVEVRLAARDGERWAALVLGVPAGGGDPALVPTDARPPAPVLEAGERLEFAGGLGATVLGRHQEARPLIWLAFDAAGERLAEALHRAGRPVRYAYVPRAWPLHHYQTLFAAGPGSAEMASAGRPFTVQTLADLRRRGVGVATISLHAGLSTYGDPATDRRFVPAEPYFVPEATATAVAATRAAGGRGIAVGTAVVRTREAAAQAGGEGGGEGAGRGGWEGGPDATPSLLRPGPGVSRLRISPGFPLAVVDGLLTGLHEPEASHLDLLGAFLTPEALERAYAAALDGGYLWHEFGDVCLLVPHRS